MKCKDFWSKKVVAGCDIGWNHGGDDTFRGLVEFVDTPFLCIDIVVLIHDLEPAITSRRGAWEAIGRACSRHLLHVDSTRTAMSIDDIAIVFAVGIASKAEGYSVTSFDGACTIDGSESSNA